MFRSRCSGCHTEGGPAPFALRTFEQARAWSSSIRRAVTSGAMPPWHADPRYGEFANDRRLPASEKAKLLAWIDGGSLPGSSSLEAAPEERPASSRRIDWSIGVPDLVFELPEDVTVPAAGEVPYHGYRVETGLAQDVWIQAAETRPAVLDFQMHYTPTGKDETDRSRIGLILAAEPPRHESLTALCSTPFLWIPAGEPDVRFEADLTFPRATRLLSLRPHMHLRGDTFEFRAEYPDGRSEILLLVTGYDFNWQTTYRFAEPRPLPAGTRLRCTATYDNSGGNPLNPDPTRDVSWGRETTDEMMIGFVDYYEEGE